MKKRIILLFSCLFLFPAAGFSQPKAGRLFHRLANKTQSEKAVQRAAKETAKNSAAKSRRLNSAQLQHLSRQDAAALDELSKELGVRVRQRVLTQQSKQQANPAKRRQQRAAALQNAQARNERFHLKEALTNIIERNPDDIVTALNQMRKMRRQRGDNANPEYFQQFATIYYKRNLKTLTPHMYDFFGQVGKIHSPSLEKDVILRMKELFALRAAFLKNLTPDAGAEILRLRYLKHVEKLNDRNFDPQSLIFSYEQRLIPSANPVFIRHVNIGSKVRIGDKHIPVSGFNYDISRITELYKYLLNENGSADGIVAVFDPASRQAAIYGPDKKVWIRVTSHEYASVNRLHIHLNETRSVTFQDEQGRTVTEPVMVNMSIPLMPKAALDPRTKKPYDLYQKLIVSPVRELQKENGARVITGPIF